jgi:hypothetical protein
VEAGIFFSLQRGSFLLELASHSHRPKIKYLGAFSSLFLFFPVPANSPDPDRIQINLDPKQ